MLDFLTYELSAALRHVNLHRVYELRLRAGKPVVVNYGGTYAYLGERGIGQETRAADKGTLKKSIAENNQIILAYRHPSGNIK